MATEKEGFSQLLQEKHQLQVAQEDRIRNLTKLLVTSNNLTCVQKVPRRRVTWGGKLLRLAHPSPSEDCLSDRSFAASVSRQRKVHFSSVMEQIEDEDFDGDWEIPDESSDDTSQCQDLMTFQSMASRAAERVAELEVELQTVGQQNQQAHDQIAAMEQKAAEVDLKLQSEMQQKSQAVDKVQLLELHVTDLKLQLEEQQLNSGQQLEDDPRYESLATEMGRLTEAGAGYTFFWIGRTEAERRDAGVSFAIKSNLVNKLAALPKGVNDRLMTLRLPLPGKHFATLISTYAPTMTNPDDVKERFYEDLTATITALPRADKLSILGDFNARVGTDQKSCEGFLGKNSTGSCNSNGTLLLDTCPAHKLLITISVFCLPKRNRTSWIRPRSKHWHLLDYVMVRQRGRQGH
ncbi:centromere-associated protein E-like [Syngnathus acus]|uniref:centromere-associated protein E-like n=1 Tax=Syngnathus acus TaxID=161584 RepID=UPI001885DBE4|nr:centromere-associated protein E-like [Syngnathus acus]